MSDCVAECIHFRATFPGEGVCLADVCSATGERDGVRRDARGRRITYASDDVMRYRCRRDDMRRIEERETLF